MPELKDICTLFDNHYEQEGKKQKATVDKLKLWISETYDHEEDEINRDWLAWMYGKVLNITNIEDELMVEKYNMIKLTYDQKSKDIVNEHHFTNMWKIMSYREE